MADIKVNGYKFNPEQVAKFKSENDFVKAFPDYCENSTPEQTATTLKLAYKMCCEKVGKATKEAESPSGK